MTLEAVGALCLGVVVGWSAAGPRSLRAAFAAGALALALTLSTAALLLTAEAASVAALGALVGFVGRLLLDLGLSATANDRRRR